MTDSSEPGLQTLAIHAGTPAPRIHGAVNVPVFQSTVFEQEDPGAYADIVYPRLSTTPTHLALGRKLAALEGADLAFATASGMAAITTTILTALGERGHLLLQDNTYGGTHWFAQHDLPKFGHEIAFFDATQGSDGWHRLLRPNTRAVYVEAMTNPLVKVADHRAVVAFARAHGLLAIVDATFATPVNFRPLALGYDLVVHSATKYLNGHSDLAAGVVAGRREPCARVLHMQNHLGGSLDPHACFLLDRGLKTLPLRMRAHNENALAVARFLEAHGAVERVHYPGLASHPHHARATELFAGCGGVLAFAVRGGAADADAVIRRLRLPIAGPSLGGIESLISRPAALSHMSLTPQERAALGIGDNLLRLSVGCEDTRDLLDDFAQALG
ncbi:MAG: PLP-dependent aspartate aminotransferase family protein [Planctomycetota bacterium]